jgi:hypothetical protein
VGEIGIPRQEYLYDLTLCDLLMIERGYYRRNIDIWSATRWSTYHIMASFVCGDALKKNGVFSPKDLLPLPWDNQPEAEHYTQEDIDGLQADIDAANAGGIQW